MVSVALIVPVYKNFQGFAELLASVDIPVLPIVIPNWRENIGVSKAWNEGIRRANGMDVAFVINDDVVFEPGSMEKIIAGLTQGLDLVTGFNTRDENYDRLKNDPQYIDSPDYACFAIKPTEFIEKFGEFDENFSPAYFEDNDMNYRIKLYGGTDKKATNAPFFHKGSVTQNWDEKPVVTSKMFESNREYYTKKWGGWPGKETFVIPFNDPNKTIKDW